MIEGDIQLIDGSGSESVTNLGPVESDTNRPLIDGSMVRDVLKRKPFDDMPSLWVEDL